MFNIKALPNPIIVIFFAVLLLFASTLKVKAQCFGYNRIYANSQTNGNNFTFPVDNESLAVGSNLTDYSSINIPSLSATRYQRLNFPQTFTGAEPIHVKLGSEVDLSVLGITLEVRAYNAGSPVGTAVTLSSGVLLNLLAGQNVSDVIIPSPSSSYDAVQITVKGGLISAGKINVYAAYVNQQAAAAINCEAVADLITGTTSGALGALNGVTNPSNAVDASLTSYATLNQNVGVAGIVHLTAIFPSASIVGDSISIIIQVPGTPLLDANVFTNLTVVTYLGNTVVETIPANSSLIGIRLLDATNHIYKFTYPSSSSFDRISIQSGGLVSALAQVYIYDIKRIIPKNILIDGVPAFSKTICIGTNTTLSINPTQTCTTYDWYTLPAGGSIVNTGTSYPRNGLAVGTYDYYIEAVRDGCTSTAPERTKVSIVVSPKLATPTLTITSN